MNQGIQLSWGCTGNALSNQQSIDDIQQDKALPDQSGKVKKTQLIRNIHGIYISIFLSECGPGRVRE